MAANHDQGQPANRGSSDDQLCRVADGNECYRITGNRHAIAQTYQDLAIRWLRSTPVVAGTQKRTSQA